MNDSGIAVRKVLARERAPLIEMLVVVDDFALPFGKLRFREGGGPGGHNGLRSIIGELGSEAFSRLRVGIGAPDAAFIDHVLTSSSRTSASGSTSSSMRPRTPSRPGRARARTRRRTGSTRSSWPVRGRGPDRAARRGRWPARPGRHSPHEDRLAEDRSNARSRASAERGARQRTPLAAREGRERARRERPVDGRQPRGRGDRDRAGRGRGRALAQAATRSRRAGHRARVRPGPAPPESRRIAAAPRRQRRVRDAAGTARPIAAPAEAGRHAGVTPVPHGAKTFLAAALALVARRADRAGSRATPRSAIGSRRSWRRGSAIPAAVAVLEPRTALAYERSELVADETAARVAALSAWRSGGARILVASVQALLQHTIAPADLPAQPRELAVGARVGQDALLRELLDLGYTPRPRGRRPRRVRAAGRHRRRVPAVGGAAGPHRILRRRDRFPARLRPDRPAHDRRGRASRAPAGLGVPPARRRCGGAARPAWAARRAAARATRPGSRAASRARSDAERAAAAPSRARSPSATPRRSGRPSSRRRPPSTTSTRRPCSSSTSPATSARPASSCGARRTSGAPSSSRRGELPRTGRRRYLAAARLEAPARSARGRSS